MRLDHINAPVKEDFQAVNALIINSLHSQASLINDLGHYIIQGGGKRLRPLVALLIARACGYNGEYHIHLAAVIELIHTATLLHDDVVDNASLRRGHNTANNVWGNEAAVLVGDYLYSKAFQILVTVGNLKVMQILADATNIMAEGEALQLLERHNPAMTEGSYLNVIRSKTAKLFEAATHICAILSNVDPETEKAMVQFGLHFGTAFQLMDDILDYQASPTQTGKNVGTDLAEGKITLPLIYLLQNGNAHDTTVIREAIREGGSQHFAAIQKMIVSSKALEYAKRFAEVEMDRAQKSLDKLKPSVFREAALALTQFALQRDH